MSDDVRSDLLNEPQHRAIDALLQGSTVRDAAKAAGKDERTLYRWLATPEFQSELRRLSEALRAAAIARASARAELMLMTLESIALDRKAKRRDRRGAAKDHLEVGLKLEGINTHSGGESVSAPPSRRIRFELDNGPPVESSSDEPSAADADAPAGDTDAG